MDRYYLMYNMIIDILYNLPNFNISKCILKLCISQNKNYKKIKIKTLKW